MLIDLQTLPAGTEFETGVCLVGTRAAGLALAREFFGESRSVSLVEGGGLEREAAADGLLECEIARRPFDGATAGAPGSSGSDVRAQAPLTRRPRRLARKRASRGQRFTRRS